RPGLLLPERLRQYFRMASSAEPTEWPGARNQLPALLRFPSVEQPVESSSASSWQIPYEPVCCPSALPSWLCDTEYTRACGLLTTANELQISSRQCKQVSTTESLNNPQFDQLPPLQDSEASPRRLQRKHAPKHVLPLLTLRPDQPEYCGSRL